MIKVKSYKDLTTLFPDVEENTMAAVEIETNKYKLFVFKNKEWIADSRSTGINLNYYDMNKMMISQLKDCDINKKLDLFSQYFDSMYNYEYFMLLCRDLNYYTLFHRGYQGSFIPDAVLDIISDTNSIFKHIKSIEIYNQDAIEIWFMDENDEAHVAYLFPYDSGVVECI